LPEVKIATLAKRAGLHPFTAAGIARVIEHGARVVGDAGKLWLGLDAAEGGESLR
jgi:hypothetical protein